MIHLNKITCEQTLYIYFNDLFDHNGNRFHTPAMSFFVEASHDSLEVFSASQDSPEMFGAWSLGYQCQPSLLTSLPRLVGRRCRNRVRCSCHRSLVMLAGLQVDEMVGLIETLICFGNEATIVVEVGRHVLVGCFGGVMFECFGDMMFECMLVGCYGRKWWYHIPHRCYGKLWWRHMFVCGISHVLDFVFECEICIGHGFGCMWFGNVGGYWWVGYHAGLVVGCMWFGNIVVLVVGCRWVGYHVWLIVGCRWVDNFVGLVVG